MQYLEAVNLVVGPLSTAEGVDTTHSLFKKFGKTCTQLYDMPMIIPNMHISWNLVSLMPFGSMTSNA